MKRIIYVTFIIMMTLSGCQNEGNSNNNSNMDYSMDEQNISKDSIVIDSISDADFHDSAINANDSKNAMAVSDYDIYDYESIMEYFKVEDKLWNEAEDYQEAVSAYCSGVGQDLKEIIAGDSNNLRIGFGYIDDDAIPELFVSDGDYHTSGIRVFTYSTKKKEIDYIGDFSSFGGIQYVEKGNRIISQYGNHGDYSFFYTAIEDGKPVLIGAIAQGEMPNDTVPGGYEAVYYVGLKVPEGIDGSRRTGDGLGAADWLDKVSEEEYIQTDDKYRGIKGEESVKSINYGEMRTIHLSPGGSTFGLDNENWENNLGEYILDVAFPERTGYWTAYERIYQAAKERFVAEDYLLEDINGDGQEELFLFEGNDHMDGVLLYTFYDGKALFLGKFGEYGKIKVDTNRHLIYSTFTSGASLHEIIFEVMENRAITLDELFASGPKPYEYRKTENEYQINKRDVPEKEYREKRSEYLTEGFIELKPGERQGGFFEP